MIHKKRTCLLSAKIGTDSSNYVNHYTSRLSSFIYGCNENGNQTVFSPFFKRKQRNTKLWTIDMILSKFTLCKSPVHSLILDLSDENWKKYFSNVDSTEMTNYNGKYLPALPAELNNHILEARQLPDTNSLKQHLKQEFASIACEWVKDTVLSYIKLFKFQQLLLNNQTEGDMFRRIWFFLDTVLDDSKINRIGGEKSSKSSCVSRNLGRTLAAEEKMDRKVVGRKVDLLFTHQRLEYGFCECGRFDDHTKQLYDGSFKMAKVLKDMMYSLYRAAPSSIRQLTLVGYLLYDTKFTTVLSDSPAGHVTRITQLSSIDLPEGVDDISIQLLTILKVVYQAGLIMEENSYLN